MTDTTDIETLRAETWELHAMQDATEFADKLLDLLEAERQRAAGSEEELHKALHREKAAERKLLAAQGEIEALKGDQVPVAYLYMGDAMECKHVELAEDTDEFQAENCVPLFTAPQKPVVLDDATILAWGERNYIQRDVSTLRCIIDDAISLPAAIEAAGGIVKDGE